MDQYRRRHRLAVDACSTLVEEIVEREKMIETQKDMVEREKMIELEEMVELALFSQEPVYLAKYAQQGALPPPNTLCHPQTHPTLSNTPKQRCTQLTA